jgi:hypothetical protein
MINKEYIKRTFSSLRLYNVFSTEHDIEFELWNEENIDEMNDGYNIAEFLPGYIGVGSNGGGEMIVVEIETGKFYSIPFIPMDISDRMLIAKSMDELIKMKK